MPEPDAQRPTPVTVIGWVWMTLGMLVLGRSLVNIIIWRAIRPAFPLVASMVGHRPEGSEWIALLFEHFTAINVAHAVVAAGILLVAWQFLRLRSWARPALRLVCVLTLIYVACLGALMAAVLPARSRARPCPRLPPIRGMVWSSLSGSRSVWRSAPAWRP